MKAVLYKSLTNKQDEIELKENTPLYMQLPDIDFENAIIIVSGTERNKDYCPKKTDIIMIRQTPSDPVTIIVGVVGAVSLGVGVYSGVKAYQANKQAEQAMAESERAMENAKKASANPSIDNRPFIAGATNTVATGQGQPYVMGRHLFTPYLLQKGFYKLGGVDGKDQFYYLALECGFNKQVIQSVNVDEVRIKTFTGQIPQEGVFDLDSGIFEDGGRLEIRQGSHFQELTDLNKKIVSQSYSSEIPKRTEENQEYNEIVLDRHAKDVEIAVTYPYGLYAYNDNNDKVSRSSQVLAQLSFDGGNTWTDPADIVNTGERNELTELRFSNTITFTSAQTTQSKTNNTSPIVRLYDNQTESEKARDKVFLLFAQSVCYDPNSPTFEDCKIVEQKELELSTVMALKIKSSQANEDKLNKINIITQSIAKTWNGSQWSEAKTPTRNPASIALEVLTSLTHEQSRFELEEIDLETFGEWYSYCEWNNYHFDYILNQKVSKESLIDRILKAGDASLYVDIYGKLAVAIDTFKANAIACFNAQNIIEIENKKSFTRAIDGVRVNYTSSANNAFTEESVLVMRDGKEYNADSVLQEIKLEGVTEYNHVVKYIRRLIATLNLRPKTTLISVGQEGVYYTPYSKILLQDDSLKIGLSSGVISKIFVQGDKIAYIETNDLVQFEVGKQYGIIVNHLLEDRAIPVAIRVSGTGRTGEIEILDNIMQGEIEAGEVFSFGELNESGEFDRITSPFLITAVSRVGNKFKIDLVDYNEAVYETGDIPMYESNITEPYKPTPAPIPTDYVTRPELDEAMHQGGTQPIGSPDIPTISTAQARENEIYLACSPFAEGEKNKIQKIQWWIKKGSSASWLYIGDSTGLEYKYDFNRAVDGFPTKTEVQSWLVKAKATNFWGKGSIETTKTVDASVYPIQDPSVPVFTAIAKERGIDIDVVRNNVSTHPQDNIVEYVYSVKKTDEWEEFLTTPNNVAVYEIGMIEKSAFENWQFKVEVKNAWQKANSAEIIVDTSTYGTWIVNEPNVITRESGRSISFALSQNQVNLYGKVKYEIQVKRTTPVADTEWYKPNLTTDPYSAENAYKDGTGSISVENNYVQTMPLKGQNDMKGTTPMPNPVDTAYMFNLTAVGENGSEASVTRAVTARATGVIDIVNSSITTTKLDENAVTTEKIHADAVTAEKIAVEILSAISANVGTINQGAFGDGTNVWDLSSFIDEHGVQRVKGRFKVGDDNGYFRVEPVYTGTGASVIITGYNVSFKAQKMTVESDKTSFEDEIDIYLSTNNATKILIAPQNIKFYGNGTLKATINEGWVNDRRIKTYTNINQFTDKTSFTDMQELVETVPDGSFCMINISAGTLTNLVPAGVTYGMIIIQKLNNVRTLLEFQNSFGGPSSSRWTGEVRITGSARLWTGWKEVSTYSDDGKATNSDGGEVVDDDLISLDSTWSSEEINSSLEDFFLATTRIHQVSANTDLNTPEYCTIGKYACRSSGTAETLSNCPTQYAFNMVVENLVGSDKSATDNAVRYFKRTLTQRHGLCFEQAVWCGSANNNLTYGDWRLRGNINDTDLDSTTTVLSANKTMEEINSAKASANTYADGKIVNGISNSETKALSANQIGIHNTFSSDEVYTGKTWFGEPVYRFCFETTGPFATGDSVFFKDVGGAFCPRPQIVSMSCVLYKGDPFFSFIEDDDGFYIKTEGGTSAFGGYIEVFANGQVVAGKQRFVIEYIYKN